ncbi:MAG: hypothetical protein SFW67_18595 [Myxococcaceae bacterium]|nr:hypothetical protein [Myxococcaceae bacterium]
MTSKTDASATAAARAAAEAARRRAAEAAARRSAEAAAKKVAEPGPRTVSQAAAKTLSETAGQRPVASGVRQVFGKDELSQGRGGSLRARASSQLGGVPSPSPSVPDTTRATSVNELRAMLARGEQPPVAPSPTTRTASASLVVTPDTVSATVEGGFSAEVTNAKGYGVSFGVNAEASVVSNRKTENGVTTFTVDGEASVTVEGGVSTPQAGLTVAHSEGLRGSYEVAMPEAAARGVDPATVNPYDPTSMPTGTVVTMSGERYSSNEFEATFRNIALATKVEEASGVSVAIEKTGEHTVRVTAGPTEAIEAYNSVGLDFGIASASLGRTDNLDSATLKTAEFDLSTPEGKAAYNAFLTSGTLPADNGAGVSDVATIEKVEYSSESSLDVSLGPIDLSFKGAKNTGSSVVTTYPDGTKDVTVGLDYSENVPMQLTRRYDAQGNEVLSERRYSFELKADENTAQLLNVSLTGDVQRAESGPVGAGQTVTLTFTEAQMREYMEMTQRASDAGFGGGPLDALVKDYDGRFIDSPEDFAIALARNLGGTDYGTAERMFGISNAADGKYDDDFTAIPATITVN